MGLFDTEPKPDHSMQRVLDEAQALGLVPIWHLTPEQARTQPTPGDGARQVMRDRGIDPDADLGIETRDFVIPGPGGDILARRYARKGEEDALPIVVYFHGGGWVIADLDTYDPTPRALALASDCVFISCHYRQAPENRFPAAHEDAWAAWQWIITNAAALGGDGERFAVMGESAGGNLAANVAIRARDAGGVRPAAQILVYPVAGNDMNTQSYVEHGEAAPLDRKSMEWFFGHVLERPEQAGDPRLNLVMADLRDLPPTTIIGAEIDPLRSEGKLLAERLESAGIDVTYKCYEGVTHEFFGMGLIVKDAAAAQGVVAFELRKRLRHGIIGKIADALSG